MKYLFPSIFRVHSEERTSGPETIRSIMLSVIMLTVIGHSSSICLKLAQR